MSRSLDKASAEAQDNLVLVHELVEILLGWLGLNHARLVKQVHMLVISSHRSKLHAFCTGRLGFHAILSITPMIATRIQLCWLTQKLESFLLYPSLLPAYVNMVCMADTAARP